MEAKLMEESEKRMGQTDNKMKDLMQRMENGITDLKATMAIISEIYEMMLKEIAHNSELMPYEIKGNMIELIKDINKDDRDGLLPSMLG
jgi:predicted DNA-binding ArsR family transcriptional regulator